MAGPREENTWPRAGDGGREGGAAGRSPVDTQRKTDHGIHSGDEERGIRKRARRKEEEERLERRGHKDRRVEMTERGEQRDEWSF